MNDESENTPITTNKTHKDKQFNSTLFLREHAERLVDVKSELTTLLSVFSDFTKLNRNQKSALHQTKTIIIPFLGESSVNVRKSSALLSPIAGSAYVHKINEKKIKGAVRDEIKIQKKQGKVKKSSPLKRVELYQKSLSDVTNATKQPTSSKSTMQTRGIRPKNLFNLPTVTSTLQPPANGNEHKPREVVKVISAHPKNIYARGTVIKHILEKKLLHVSYSALHKVLKRDEEHKEVRVEWNMPGPPMLLNDKDTNDLNKELTKKGGSTFGKKTSKLKSRRVKSKQ